MGTFREVTKEEFEAAYSHLGGGRSGWTRDYWNAHFGDPLRHAGWRFLIEDPASAAHDQMWIVTDHGTREYRLFFADESTDEILRAPDVD